MASEEGRCELEFKKLDVRLIVELLGWGEGLKAATLPLVARLSKSMISAKAVGNLTALVRGAPGS
jgi:hypothetical protein